MVNTAAFFETLFKDCTGSVNIRPITCAGYPHNEFHPIDDLSWISSVIESHMRDNLFFGVATRDGVDGKATKENIVDIPALWCDIDFKETPQKEADKQLADFPIPPTAIILSGGGYHLYWLLKEAATKENIPAVEDMLKRICVYFHADSNATDASRVLRVPGSFNHKYRPIRRVALQDDIHADRAYNMLDFDFLPETQQSQQNATPATKATQKQLDILLKCNFIRWCKDNPKSVSEPLWYALISNVARIDPGGPALCHELSKGYPRYSYRETQAKIEHALNDAGPQTCQRIKATGFDCEKDCNVKSPIGLLAKDTKDKKREYARSGPGTLAERVAAATMENYKDLLPKIIELDDKIEQELLRKTLSKALGVPVATIREATQSDEKREEKQPIVEDVESWDEPVNEEELLNEIRAIIAKHVIVEAEAIDACSLWVVLTYCYDVYSILPMLGITSPEKRCGKTTLLQVLAGLADRALPASNISPAAVYRTIEAYRPCLLIDEADTFLKDNDELKGIINSGHTRDTAFTIRINPTTLEVERFSTWGPKAISLIGNLPETPEDRSISIRMKRKTSSEKVERLPLTFKEDQADLRRKLKKWAIDNMEVLKATQPTIPEVGNDRAVDNWTPLMVIAILAGGNWPEKTCKAMLAIEGKEDEVSIMQVLLGDIQEIFNRSSYGKIPSRELVEGLIAIEDHPWNDLRRGRAITQNGLARLLKPFGIHPKPVRINETVSKGYHQEQFIDVFKRYIPPPAPIETVTPLQSASEANLQGFQTVTPIPNVTVEKAHKPASINDCNGVTDERRCPPSQENTEGLRPAVGFNKRDPEIFDLTEDGYEEY